MKTTDYNNEVDRITKENLDLDFMENWWDSAGLKLISINDTNEPKTNILKKSLEKIMFI